MGTDSWACWSSRMEPVQEWPVVREMTPTIALEAIPNLGAVKVAPVLPIGDKSPRNQQVRLTALTCTFDQVDREPMGLLDSQGTHVKAVCDNCRVDAEVCCLREHGPAARKFAV